MSVFKGLSLPKTLHKVDSKYNGEIKVMLDNETKSLKASGVTQSINHDSPHALRAFWGRLVALVKREEPDVKSVLVLGLGGATVQHLIAKHLPGAYIVSVEIDEVMVDVARKHFDLDAIPNHKIIVDDACRVVIHPEEFGLKFKSFSAVIVDIYCGSEFPELGTSGNFLAHLKDMVVPGGLVVINRIYFQEHQDDVDAFLQNVEGFLTGVKTFLIPGKTNSDNMIIYGRT